MKKLILSLLSVVSLSAFAQDVIICRNGDEITSKVLKVSQTEIEYKKWSNQDGPSYTLDKSEVFMIKYKNGEKDVFKEEPAPQTAPAAEQQYAQEEPTTNEPIMATPASNNAELIALYNNDNHKYVPQYPDKTNNSRAKTIIGTLGVISSSILSTDDIEITFKHIEHFSKIENEGAGDTYYDNYTLTYNRLKYAIIIKNKTSRVIYIDKAACLGTYSTGETKKYYNHEEYTVTEGADSGSGASVNLGSVANALGVGGVVGTLAGGVNVGGNKGKFSSVTKTYKDDRLITIPPHASVALSEDDVKEHPTKKNVRIVVGSYEYFSIPKMSSLKIDEIRAFTEENTPKSINYMITYSFDKELSKCLMVNFGVYLKDVFGIKRYSSLNGVDEKRIEGKIVKTNNTIMGTNGRNDEQ